MNGRDEDRGRLSDPGGESIARAGQMFPVPYDPVNHSEGLLAPYNPTEPKTPLRPWSLERLLRFKWTVLAVALLVAAPALAAIWTFSVPKYTAKAEVRVRPIIPRLVFNTEENGMIPLYQSYMNTQVSIMRTPSVLERTLDQAVVQNTGWYKTAPRSILRLGSAPSPLERLRDDLSVSPRGQTEIIDVSMTALRGEEAAIIVNAVLDQYIKYTREQSDATGDLLYRKLTDEQESLGAEIQGREKTVAMLAKTLGTSTPDQLVSQMRLRLDDSERKLETLQQGLAVAQWQEKELTAMLPKENPKEKPANDPSSAVPIQRTSPAPSQPPYESDELWRQFYHDLAMVKVQAQIEGQKLKDTHPRKIELQEHVAASEKMLRSREQELDAQWKAHPKVLMSSGLPTMTGSSVKTGSDVGKELEAVRQQIKLLKFQEQLQTEDTQAQRVAFERVFESAQLLNKENEAIHYKRGLYEAVRTRVDQKEMERNVPGAIEVLTRATPPSEASNDRRLLMSQLALIGGLGAGVGVAFLRGSTTQTIHQLDDLHQVSTSPFLGRLPYIRSKPQSPLEGEEQLQEAIRMLRTALLQRIDSQKGCIVQVTSAEPGAGKSTIAAMLASSLAHCGKKVLLVDADLRSPTFAKRFGVPQDPGLLGALMGKKDSETILGTDTPRLSILPAGCMHHVADAELMTNGVLTACFERWQQQYDLVLLDSPPLLPVADARILASKAYGSIMVVRERRSRRDSVFEALNYLQTAGGNLLGVVFIGSKGHGGYPYYSYRYDYGSGANKSSDGHHESHV